MHKKPSILLYPESPPRIERQRNTRHLTTIVETRRREHKSSQDFSYCFPIFLELGSSEDKLEFLFKYNSSYGRKVSVNCYVELEAY